jgi:hypothetical protein
VCMHACMYFSSLSSPIQMWNASPIFPAAPPDPSYMDMGEVQ